MINPTIYITPLERRNGRIILQEGAEIIVPKFNCGVIQDSPKYKF